MSSRLRTSSAWIVGSGSGGEKTLLIHSRRKSLSSRKFANLIIAADKRLPCSPHICPSTVIGSGTTVGNHTQILNSVVGEGCKIGSNVSIDGCDIFENVTIEDVCKLKHAVVCDGVIIRSKAVLGPGVVLGSKVIVGQHSHIFAYSKESLVSKPTLSESGKELEYADNSSETTETPSVSTWSGKSNAESTMLLSESQLKAKSEVGSGGTGFIRSTRMNYFPIPADKVDKILRISKNKIVDPQSYGVIPPPVKLEPDPYDSKIYDRYDFYHLFEKQVEETFLKGVHENVNAESLVLKVNSLRLLCYLTFSDSAGALFYAMMKLALHAPYGSPIAVLLNPARMSEERGNANQKGKKGELLKNVANVMLKWRKLLKYYLRGIVEEIAVILKFEKMCLESTKCYSPLFEQILYHLYDKDLIQEEAILKWASEKENAEEADKVFVKQSEEFIQWLNEASEEE